MRSNNGDKPIVIDGISGWWGPGGAITKAD